MVNVIDAFIRGLEKPIILWLLSLKPRYGSELIKEFESLTGRKLKPGIVYPFLQWLERGVCREQADYERKAQIKMLFSNRKGSGAIKESSSQI